MEVINHLLWCQHQQLHQLHARSVSHLSWDNPCLLLSYFSWRIAIHIINNALGVVHFQNYHSGYDDNNHQLNLWIHEDICIARVRYGYSTTCQGGMMQQQVRGEYKESRLLHPLPRPRTSWARLTSRPLRGSYGGHSMGGCLRCWEFWGSMISLGRWGSNTHHMSSPSIRLLHWTKATTRNTWLQLFIRLQGYLYSIVCSYLKQYSSRTSREWLKNISHAIIVFATLLVHKF